MTGDVYKRQVHLNPFHVFHHQHPAGGEGLVYFWTGHILNIPVQTAEFLNMAGFLQKVHFLLGDHPHLINNSGEIQSIPKIAHGFEDAHRFSHQSDILRHRLADTGALDFHDYPSFVL